MSTPQTVVMATVVDGQLTLDRTLRFPDGTRVELTIERLDDIIAERKEAFAEFRKLVEERVVESQEAPAPSDLLDAPTAV